MLKLFSLATFLIGYNAPVERNCPAQKLRVWVHFMCRAISVSDVLFPWSVAETGTKRWRGLHPLNWGVPVGRKGVARCAPREREG